MTPHDKIERIEAEWIHTGGMAFAKKILRVYVRGTLTQDVATEVIDHVLRDIAQRQTADITDVVLVGGVSA